VQIVEIYVMAEYAVVLISGRRVRTDERSKSMNMILLGVFVSGSNSRRYADFGNAPSRAIE
jgi:hypothetical protein